jgi:hypothetical protein
MNSELSMRRKHLRGPCHPFFVGCDRACFYSLDQKLHIVVGFMMALGSCKESSVTIFRSEPHLVEMVLCNMNGQFTDMYQTGFPNTQF